MNVKFRCPHCGEEIDEVEVVMLTWKRLLVSVGLGVGCGLFIFPLVHKDAIVAAIGAFVVSFIIVSLAWKGK